MKNKSWLFLLLPFALLQAACGPQYFFEEKKEITAGQWAYQDTLGFRFTIPDTLNTYNLYLDFEYADTFATQNLYLKLHTLFPDGKQMSKQKSFDFFTAQGTPLGKCSGHKCRLHVLLQEKTRFNQPGVYSITLEQYTRRDPLPGIYAAGLTIERTALK